MDALVDPQQRQPFLERLQVEAGRELGREVSHRAVQCAAATLVYTSG